MIRALVEQTFDQYKKYFVLAGSSQDTKPTAGVVTGSKFLEVDTGTEYAFDEASNAWIALGLTPEEAKAAIADEVSDWLDAHPEATTTVEDGAITYAKLDASLQGSVDDVSSLKSALTQKTSIDATAKITGNREIVFASGKIDNTTSPVDTTVVADATFMCAVVDCAEGDIFTVDLYGYSPYVAYAFINSSNVPVSYSTTAQARGTITAPEGAAKLILNGSVSRTVFACAGKLIADKLAGTDAVASKAAADLLAVTGNESIAITDKGYIATNGDTADISSTASPNTYLHVVVSADPGDVFTVTGEGGATPRLWAYLGAESNGVRPVLKKSDENITLTNGLTDPAPANTKLLVINVKKASPYSLYRGDVIQYRVARDEARIGQIESDMTDGYKYDLPTPSITDGRYVSSSSGHPTDANSCYSDYIPVIPGRTVIVKNVYLTSGRSICGYDANKNFVEPAILTGSSLTQYKFVVPAGVYYIAATGHIGVPPTAEMSYPSYEDMLKDYNATHVYIPERFRGMSVHPYIVTLIDDDGDNYTEMEKLADLCDDLGMKCTFATIAKTLDPDHPDYTSTAAQHITDLLGLQSRGFHIANHTYDHSRWYGEGIHGEPQFTLAECEEDLLKSFEIFDKNGFVDASKYFVYTGSSSVQAGRPEIVQKWCECAATIIAGVNTIKTSTRHNLLRNSITVSGGESATEEAIAAALADKQSIIDNAYAGGPCWLIMYTHCKQYTSAYNSSLTSSVLAYAISKGFVPMTYNQAWQFAKGKYYMQEAIGY